MKTFDCVWSVRTQHRGSTQCVHINSQYIHIYIYMHICMWAKICQILLRILIKNLFNREFICFNASLCVGGLSYLYIIFIILKDWRLVTVEVFFGRASPPICDARLDAFQQIERHTVSTKPPQNDLLFHVRNTLSGVGIPCRIYYTSIIYKNACLYIYC